MIGNARRTLCDFLDENRQRLAEVLADAEYLAELGDFRQAELRFADFRCSLGRLLLAEESYIYPVLGAGSPDHAQRIRHALEHHDGIRAMTGVGWNELSRSDADSFRDTAARVRWLLEEHLRHENELLRGSLSEPVASLELWSILRRLGLD